MVRRRTGLITERHSFETADCPGTPPQRPYYDLLSSLAAVNPERMHAFVVAWKSRDVDELVGGQQELRTLVTGLRTVGGGRALIDGAFDKLICSVHSWLPT